MTPAQHLILEAWHLIQEADFATLSANSELAAGALEFSPADELTKAISKLTISAQKLLQAKTLLK
jgi:hypothetical protein